MTRSKFAPALLLGAASWLVAGAPAAQAQLQGTVFRYDSAPLASPAVYIAFDRAVAGDAPGQATAFHAKVRVLSEGGADGIFIADPVGGDSVVALRDQQAPPAASFRRFERPTINAAGDVAFSARLVNGLEGVFRSGPVPVATTGNSAVTLASGTLDTFDLPIITDDGQVVFHATVFGGPVVGPITVGAAIFRCAGGDGNCSSGTGTLEALVAEGDLVPDRPGRSLCDLFRGVSASNYGIAFKAVAKLDCSNLAEPPLVGVFRLAYGGALTTVAFEGDGAQPSPGMAGTVYGLFEDVPVINNLGAITFLGNVTGVFALNSIYVCDTATCPAAPAAIAVSNGDLDADGEFLSRLGAPHISDVGDISLRADARGISNAAGVFVWRAAADVVEKIAVKGDGVPDDPLAVFRRIDRPWMSPGGRVAFGANTKGINGGFSRRGIFLFE